MTQNRLLKDLHNCQKLSFPVDKASGEQRHHNTLLVDFVYSRAFATLDATQWGLNRELATIISKMTNIQLHPRDGLLADSNTGLVGGLYIS
ncbi:MAG TPA: hypothetical protein ACHBX0_03875 [Arsenophonus sp.]